METWILFKILTRFKNYCTSVSGERICCYRRSGCLLDSGLDIGRAAAALWRLFKRFLPQTAWFSQNEMVNAPSQMFLQTQPFSC